MLFSLCFEKWLSTYAKSGSVGEHTDTIRGSDAGLHVLEDVVDGTGGHFLATSVDALVFGSGMCTLVCGGSPRVTDLVATERAFYHVVLAASI